MSKKIKEINFAELIPIRMRKYEELENGNTAVSQPRFFNSFAKNLADRILQKPDVKVRLDERGSFVWNLCDGSNTMGDIEKKFREKFEEDDAAERIQYFMQYLEKCEMISYKNIGNLKNG